MARPHPGLLDSDGEGFCQASSASEDDERAESRPGAETQS